MATIRLARPEDLDAIMAIIAQTVLLMREQNNPQWDESYPQAAHFAADIEKGELYICDIDGQVGGFACINTEEAPEYASLAWSQDAPATVVHRMAVSPAFRRQGIARQLMEAAEEYARTHTGGYLRTDTYSQNKAMNALFERMGYSFAEHVRFRNKPDVFNCYEKTL